MLTDEELKKIAVKWLAAFSYGGSGEGFAATYAPDGCYHDHAFNLIRTGHAILARHRDIWVHAIPDVVMEIYHFEKQQNGFSIRYTGRGNFVNDLPSMKATQKVFEFRGVVDFVVDDDGLIKKTEDFYSTGFGNSVPLADYNSLPSQMIS